ncbi:GNAT family N-acetyltransferase [Ascidiaceihabitans sp.]|uniref:GNAT family N-acetyltransferase n=1 Tax=Ascidiaceihabitans sp. TaxID=1872644 RepID=UPI003297F99F
MIDVRVVPHEDLENQLDDLAALRIAVFRDWPYLYDGDLAYERQYLQMYRNTNRAVVVGAFDGDWMVGAATGAPLGEHADDFAAAFEGTDVDVDATFYCAESVLMPSYRGQGIGHRFFDRREKFAADLGFENICFCAVDRPVTHPSRPATPRDLSSFWAGRGYAQLPGVKATFAWRDVGDALQTQKKLQIWMRHLDA